MDKPKDVSQEAWNIADAIGEAIYGRHERGFVMWPLISASGVKPQSVVARALDGAILSAQSQAYIDAARIASDLPLTEFKGASPALLVPESLWMGGAGVQAGSISAAILQRKEEIGR